MGKTPLPPPLPPVPPSLTDLFYIHRGLVLTSVRRMVFYNVTTKCWKFRISFNFLNVNRKNLRAYKRRVCTEQLLRESTVRNNPWEARLIPTFDFCQLKSTISIHVLGEPWACKARRLFQDRLTLICPALFMSAFTVVFFTRLSARGSTAHTIKKGIQLTLSESSIC